jgi:D-ribose pyranase
MKKIGIINSEISAVIGAMGHTDTLVVVDAGFPIPDSTVRIDMALRPGVPTFLETLETVLEELFVEKIIVAEEIDRYSPQILAGIQKLLPGVPVEKIPHVEFKRQSGSARAIVRTGEFTPYANVILAAGAWGFKL